VHIICTFIVYAHLVFIKRDNKMNKIDVLKHICSGILILSLGACGSSSDDVATDNTTPTDNAAPIVDAGADQTVNEATLVTLDLTVTDDDTVTVTWSQTSGDSVTLSDTNVNSPTFTAPSVDTDTTLVFQASVNDGVNSAVTDTVSIMVSDTDSVVTTSPWIINDTTTSTYMDGVVEDVQLAETVTVDNVEYTYVEATGIPKYDVTITQTMVDDLNSRPRAVSHDFTDGVTTAKAGDIVEFGEDIGFNSSTENCLSTGGDGYWPPGPGCPTVQTVEAYIVNEPTDLAENEICETGLGTIGLMVNGAAIFNWGDGMSYGTNEWYNLAPIAEQYDVGICGGHAAGGEYHHHFYTSCLATLLGDNGDEHSPIYGFAADGYPLYGPYEGNDLLALSGWEMRDYGAATSEGGCGTEGERTCVLVNQYDVSQGVVDAGSDGPTIGQSVSTLSGNSIPATDGYYLEDYYYAQAPVTGAVLDEHNGHDTNDGKGYHYHLTIAEEDGVIIPTFPFMMGPRFKGEVPANSFGSCDTGGGQSGGDAPGGDAPELDFEAGVTYLATLGVTTTADELDTILQGLSRPPLASEVADALNITEAEATEFMSQIGLPTG
jgi:hypothetical protein